MNEIQEQISALESEKKALLKKMHPSCHTVADVEQEIKDLDRRLTTTTLPAAVEHKIIKELQQLKDSIPHAKKLTPIDP